MNFTAKFVRVMAYSELMPFVEGSAYFDARTRLKIAADLKYRMREWQPAIADAEQALLTSPNDFHMLAIVAMSYGYLGQDQQAHTYAKRLLTSSPPSWGMVKLICAALGVFYVAVGRKREIFFGGLRRCDAEAEADRSARTWAADLVKTQA